MGEKQESPYITHKDQLNWNRGFMFSIAGILVIIIGAWVNLSNQVQANKMEIEYREKKDLEDEVFNDWVKIKLESISNYIISENAKKELREELENKK